MSPGQMMPQQMSLICPQQTSSNDLIYSSNTLWNCLSISQELREFRKQITEDYRVLITKQTRAELLQTKLSKLTVGLKHLCFVRPCCLIGYVTPIFVVRSSTNMSLCMYITCVCVEKKIITRGCGIWFSNIIKQC